MIPLPVVLIAPRRDFRARLRHFLNMLLNREDRGARTDNDDGLARVGDNVHFDGVCVQIGGEFHRDRAIPNGGSKHHGLP